MPAKMSARPSVLQVRRDVPPPELIKTFTYLKYPNEMVIFDGYPLKQERASGPVDFSTAAFEPFTHVEVRPLIERRDDLILRGHSPFDVYDAYALITEPEHRTLRWMRQFVRGFIIGGTIFEQRTNILGEPELWFLKLFCDVHEWRHSICMITCEMHPELQLAIIPSQKAVGANVWPALAHAD